MELRLLTVFVSLSVAVIAAHAALSPERYWDSVLPNTPMPKAIRELLRPDYVEDKSTTVGVGKGGVNVDAGKGKPGGTSVGVGKGGVNVHAAKGKPGRTDVNVGKGGVNVHTGRKGKPIYVGVGGGSNPFLYKYAATETQLHDHPNVALFFLEKDLRPGSKLTLHFPKTTSPEPSSSFLPRQVAETLPFSSQQLPQILARFSVEPATPAAGSIEQTLKECEEPAVKREEKLCATSLESMVDFSVSKLGKEVEPMSTEVERETALEEFTVSSAVKKTSGGRAVACHKQNYPYAVFYCHFTDKTAAYRVGLLGADGTRANAVAVCHADTSAWNPKHLAFQVLKVKPGTVPVCHFLPQDHVVWVPKY